MDFFHQNEPKFLILLNDIEISIHSHDILQGCLFLLHILWNFIEMSWHFHRIFHCRLWRLFQPKKVSKDGIKFYDISMISHRILLLGYFCSRCSLKLYTVILFYNWMIELWVFRRKWCTHFVLGKVHSIFTFHIRSQNLKIPRYEE